MTECQQVSTITYVTYVERPLWGGTTERYFVKNEDGEFLVVSHFGSDLYTTE